MINEKLAPYLLAFFLTSMFVATAAASTTPRVADLTASDGTKLKVSYFSAGKPGPGVLLLHQCNRQRTIWDGLAQQLSAAGINVLTLDYRGYGESGGKPFDKLTPDEQGAVQAKLPGDIDIAFQYLLAQPGVDKNMIGMGGASCGVDNSVQVALRHPEVHSLVLLSGTTDYNGRQFLRSSKAGPVFLAYADDDEFPDSPVTIQWLYVMTANPEKKLVHYSNGGHGADIFRAHPELMSAITDWYVTTLIKAPGHAPATQDSVAMSEQVRALNLIDEPGGPAKVSAMLKETRQKDPKAVLFREDLVNAMGYERLQSGDVEDAIQIMKLNVAAYPNSPNAYDSLGDAYISAGLRDLAWQSTMKCLQLLATDTTDPQQRRDAIKGNAEFKLQQLGDMSQ